MAICNYAGIVGRFRGLRITEALAYDNHRAKIRLENGTVRLAKTEDIDLFVEWFGDKVYWFSGRRNVK